MSTTSEYGEEEWTRVRTEEVKRRATGPLPPSENELQDEIAELESQDRELTYIDPEANEVHAPGKVCARCGKVLSADDDARSEVDGRWVHSVCD